MHSILSMAILPLTIVAAVSLGIGCGYVAIAEFLGTLGRRRQKEAPATVAVTVHAAGD